MRFPFSQDDLKKIMGLYMRGLRILKRATLSSMANSLGHKNSTFILAIEQGRQAVPIDKLLDYASAYGADKVYFPRVVLLVWYPRVWEWFKDNLHRDDNWEHSMEKQQWAGRYADEELIGLVIHGLFDMMFLYKFKYQKQLQSLISCVHGWPIRKPALPFHLTPEFIKQCEDEIHQKNNDEDAIIARSARIKQESVDRRMRNKSPSLKRRKNKT